MNYSPVQIRDIKFKVILKVFARMVLMMNGGKSRAVIFVRVIQRIPEEVVPRYLNSVGG